MDHALKMSFVVILFLFTWLSQEENQAWDVQRTLLKNANNSAVHDAALQIDKTQRAKGRIIIDPDRAWDVYQETLRLNLGLDSMMKATVGSPIQGSVTVLDFIILDDSNSTFPMLYEHSTYNITKYLTGPAVVAVVEIPHPRLINFSFTHSPIRVPSIYELNPNQ